MIRSLKKAGASEDVIKEFAEKFNKKGLDWLNAKSAFKYTDDELRKLAALGDNLFDCSDELLDVFKKSSHQDDIIDAIAKHGKDAADVIASYKDEATELIAKYGDDAVKAMKNGIDPALVKKLDDLGIDPSKYDELGIVGRESAEAVAEAVDISIIKAKEIGISDEVQIAKISENTAEALSKGRKFTEPTLPIGGKPRGDYAIPDPNDPRPIELQNQAADLLASKGYDIKMLPEKVGGNGHGVSPMSNPDYLINGIAFDCYSPKANTSVRNIWSTVKRKVEEQARRIILNLDDYAGSLDDISKQFYEWNHDLQRLEELIIIKDGKIARLISN